MNRLMFALMVIVIGSGCARKEEFAGAPAPMAAKAQAERGKASAFLAYEHALSIDTDEQKIAAIFEAAQMACHEAAEALCTVLESRIDAGREGSALLKFRAKPEGILQLKAVLSRQGEVVDQSTTAEDLAAPIADAAKQQAMLKDYRTRLENLRDHTTSHDVEALIKIHHELAQVQSELEAISGTHAHLMQRVQTEILRVYIRSVQHRSFWKPISQAMGDFGGNLSQGVAVAITGTAFLIPWVVLLTVLAWGGRKLWRRRKVAQADA
ncbi:MAG: DUF4349 domain-containing protein [Leptothrix sp. (in: b-proteobacteria)]